MGTFPAFSPRSTQGSAEPFRLPCHCIKNLLRGFEQGAVLPFSAVVLGISLVTTVAGRDLLDFFATGGSYSWSSDPCPLSLSFCSGTRIAFTRWDVPDPLSVHSKLSILCATIRATVDLVSSCVTMGGMTTRFSRCSLITFHAYSVSISSTRS